jgi:hypothetical protein
MTTSMGAKPQEVLMGTYLVPRTAQPNGDLHPAIYKTLIGLTLWLVFSIWLLFDRGKYVGLNLTMITAFFAVLVGIPIMLWAVWRREAAEAQTEEPAERFGAWKRRAFQTWSGGLTGGEAAAQILLPIAAVSIGMTIFGLVFFFTVPHLG